MPSHAKKTTKKFEKNHLKDIIGRRKDSAKIKQRHQVKAKKKAKNASERREELANKQSNGTTVKAAGMEEADGKKFADMTVDEFFQGGFDIPEEAGKKKGKGPKSKEIPEKIGKRKRTEENPTATLASSSEISAEEDVASMESEPQSELEEDLDTHKGDLKALSEKDPEFYKYLKENDAELLDFAEDGDLAEVDDLSAGETEQEEKPKSKKRKKSSKAKNAPEERLEKGEDETEITMAMVKKWKAAMTEQHSLRAMRQVVLAFRAAAHVNEDDGKEYKYTISSSDVYHELLVLTLKHVPDVLNHHLPVKETASGKVRIATESKKFKTLTPLLKSHSSSVHHLLTTLSDAPTLKLTLSSIIPLLPYLLPFKKAIKVLLKTVVAVWSDTSSTEATRITAFLVIRQLAVIGDAGIREAALRNAYQGLVKGSRNTTVHSLPGINLMKNSAAELWGIDQNIGYTTGFTFIRQLAIHLRGSITNTSNESYKQIYNWQYTHSLDFWSRVLSSHADALTEAAAAKPSPLRPLIYPAVQITLGAMRLIPTAQYFPLRFHLVRSLLRLSRATGTYIPLAPALLEVLNSAELKKAPKPSTLKPLDFGTAVRAPKSYLRTRVYQDGVGDQVAELLAEFFVLWTKSIAFPELALPVTVMLKRWLKSVSVSSSSSQHKNSQIKAQGNAHGGGGGGGGGGNKNTKLNSSVALLVRKLEANGRWVEERRAKVEFAPTDRAQVEAFLRDVRWEESPLGTFVVGQRGARAERERVVEEGRRAEEGKRAKEREGEGEGEGESFSEDMDDEVDEDVGNDEENSDDEDED
ncbi:Nucleolar Complex 2 protein [Acarospora aff. strigata]|nr:Nucleolar Complex 2 protein [Acarospora aff. strigata]